ncbi:MAG TPA: hypothetical protein VF934_00905 [Burkholderiales bacterium]
MNDLAHMMDDMSWRFHQTERTVDPARDFSPNYKIEIHITRGNILARDGMR